MRVTLRRMILSGLMGTLAITAMMYVVAPLLTGRPLDVAAMLSGVLGVSWGLGLLIHATLGTVVFPGVFGLVLYRVVPAPPWLRGVLWGGVLWILAEAVVVPIAGGGFFHAKAGGVGAGVASLLGHIAYGVVLSTLMGETREMKPYEAGIPRENLPAYENDVRART